MTMADTPTVELDAPYSGPDGVPMAWERASGVFADAAIYWLSTVRTDGRPHVTPVIAVWHDAVAYFCTGPEEQKAKNLRTNNHVALTTGNNGWNAVDVIIEGRAERVSDEARLRELAAAWVHRYGEDWRFSVAGHAFHHSGGEAWVFAVRPDKAYSYDRVAPGGATRYRF
jgi:general stress protein 26